MNSITQELVSVGVPVFNGERYLAQSLNSICTQTYKHLDIIISNDNSSDKSISIIKKFEQKDKRIRVFIQCHTIGAISNFNFVLKKARGPYFMWAAQDDIHDPKFIQTLLSQMKKSNDVVLAMSDYRNTYKNKLYRIYIPPIQVQLQTQTSSLDYFLHTHNLSLFYGLYQTAMLKKIGGYHADIRPYFKSSDFLTILKILLNGKLAFVPKILFYKRDTGGYTQRFTLIRDRISQKKTIQKIMRYMLFPIHYIFDFIYGTYYIIASPLPLRDAVPAIMQLMLLTLIQWYSFFKNIAISITLIMQKKILKL